HRVSGKAAVVTAEHVHRCSNCVVVRKPLLPKHHFPCITADARQRQTQTLPVRTAATSLIVRIAKFQISRIKRDLDFGKQASSACKRMPGLATDTRIGITKGVVAVHVRGLVRMYCLKLGPLRCIQAEPILICCSWRRRKKG